MNPVLNGKRPHAIAPSWWGRAACRAGWLLQRRTSSINGQGTMPSIGSVGCVSMNIEKLSGVSLLALFRSRRADNIYLSRSTDNGRTSTDPAATDCRTAIPRSSLRVWIRAISRLSLTTSAPRFLLRYFLTTFRAAPETPSNRRQRANWPNTRTSSASRTAWAASKASSASSKRFAT